MSNPIIADNKPMKVTLEQGKKYMFCACGRSNDQPFCDGSHKGTVRWTPSVGQPEGAVKL
ncbi:Iron-binding zinc finger CDGSH type [Marinobacter segnicrescens]|uniref:Iron-binding zinc finger CDGSH type n=1 Tax=Marinobacter segnicrescens TaxID=430453 RepID=A0A1I0GSW5_9GAMM|nr:CDGSH iron-sulfur domain-containing protein [Marinobacter segnicrescens]SET74421.1 Iron-binding zinc finger CDGSH type [Marinobacter segnicrescens]